MAIITLTSGWTDDFYLAILKGRLLSALPNAQLVDLSHRAPPLSAGISHAAYILKHSFPYYPQGTIHIISVNSEYSETTPFVAAHYHDQYFIGTDNGVFSLIFDEAPEAIVRIESFSDEVAPTFPAFSVFAPAAVHLASGGNIAALGAPYTDMNRLAPLLPMLTDSTISGTVLYINGFGNATTNISREDFDMVGQGREFEILVQQYNKKITRINRYFRETRHYDQLAIFNVAGLLEVAVNESNMAVSRGLIPGQSEVLVKFTGALSPKQMKG